MISKILRLAIALVLALTVVGSAAAHANPADVIRRGNCSGSSDWKLKLSPEDGRIEVEFEVDSNVAGQTWQVRLTKNGNQIFGVEPNPEMRKAGEQTLSSYPKFESVDGTAESTTLILSRQQEHDRVNRWRVRRLRAR